MEPAYEIAKRFELSGLVRQFGLDGDILVRRSLGTGPLGIPFMKWVAKYTKSKYTHAALLFFMDGSPWVLEVTDIGTMCYRLLDWLTFCPDGDFEMYRARMTDEQRQEVRTQIDVTLLLDPGYDFTFEDDSKLYCTESVCLIYDAVGIKLMNPLPLKALIPNKFAMKMISFLNTYSLKWFGQGLPLKKPLYFVGNKDWGMLSSEHLERVPYESQKIGYR